MRILRPIARAYQIYQNVKRALDPNQQDLLRRIFLGDVGMRTSAGKSVTPEKGLEQEIPFRCINLIASTTAGLPCPVYERLSGGGKERKPRNRVHQILNVQANSKMTAFTWRRLSMVHMLGWGNAFSRIERNNRNEVIALNPMHPADVQIVGLDRNGDLVYEWTDKKKRKFKFRQNQVLHLRDVSYDGILGISRIMQQREIIGRSMAREEFQNRFYVNGASSSGVLMTEESLDEDEFERMRRQFDELYGGSNNAHRPILLDAGMSYKPTSVNQRDAQTLESGKFDAARIASIYGVPLQLVNDMDSATRASTEQLFREFVQLTLGEHLPNLEQQFQMSLLREPEKRRGLFIEHVVDGLLRGDPDTRNEALKDAVLSARMTPNEARAKENLNPIDGGDVLMAPVNMIPLDQLGQQEEIETIDENGNRVHIKLKSITNGQERSEDGRKHTRTVEDHRKIVDSIRPLYEDFFDRALKREVRDIRKMLKSHLGKRDRRSFRKAIQRYYNQNGRFNGFVKRGARPILTNAEAQVRASVEDELGGVSLADLTIYRQEYIDILAERYTATSRYQIEKLVEENADNTKLLTIVEKRLAEWEANADDNPSKAVKWAREESSRAVNAIARELYLESGKVSTLVWVTFGRDCPICTRLEGKRIPIEEPFVREGETVHNLTTRKNITHPPIHQGCDCMVVPG